MQKIVTNLWFDGRVEEALELYTSLLPDSRVIQIRRYGDVGMGDPGDILTADFELAGQRFTIINGNSFCEHSAAMSLMVLCEDQEEVDRLWDGLIAGGGAPSRCGWLTDRFGVSWQITPIRLMEMLKSEDAAAVERVMAAFMPMDKLIIAELERAFNDR
ncbi:MAG: VOC family protein [Chloroflexota bacterium]|nr:VOC family protein [Chloroflexota bacterium]MDE2948405.1 VOC family protein [Chloroflexota bacterium]